MNFLLHQHIWFFWKFWGVFLSATLFLFSPPWNNYHIQEGKRRPSLTKRFKQICTYDTVAWNSHIPAAVTSRYSNSDASDSWSSSSSYFCHVITAQKRYCSSPGMHCNKLKNTYKISNMVYSNHVMLSFIFYDLYDDDVAADEDILLKAHHLAGGGNTRTVVFCSSLFTTCFGDRGLHSILTIVRSTLVCFCVHVRGWVCVKAEKGWGCVTRYHVHRWCVPLLF